ncbi:AAA family ATPase [Aquamicrobium sp.]|uniref:AAA family ATPase n=1 Tax=Aquamicrobium sp. TaxID=1872579 RepID=UPI0025898E0F|nr:AAA family ATPase [Aquamicrobium sp.]MCK9553631.1 AAA family ATPase [Aquamicrobium sp.]
MSKTSKTVMTISNEDTIVKAVSVQEIGKNGVLHGIVYKHSNVGFVYEDGNDFLEGTMPMDKVKKIIAVNGISQDQEKSLLENYGIVPQRDGSIGGDLFFTSFFADINLESLDFNPTEEVSKAFGFLSKNAFKRHVLLIGPAGTGKTYAAGQWCDKSQIEPIFIGGSPDMEAIDLRGNIIPYVDASGDKKFIWVDGPLSQAFRAAQKSKVVLIVDEMLRLSSNAQGILISSLTPNYHGSFVLNTGNIIASEDGSYHTETISVKKENLFVIATTNIGYGYDVGDINLALEDRFSILEMPLDYEFIKAQSEKDCLKNGFNKKVAGKLLKTFDVLTNMHKAKMVDKCINFRHLSEIISDANSESGIKEIILDKTPKWSGRQTDGSLIEDQTEQIRQAVLRIWG